jgi:endonuclease/exonuclease/phosphatase family metal-dependent hydrolase
MIFRIATFNLEQDHKRWDARRELIAAQMIDLNPDLLALNEIHLPTQTGRWLQQMAASSTGKNFALVQQSKAGEESHIQGEGLLTRYPPIETANLDYRSHNCVALVTRLEIGKRLIDVYVTHLIADRVEDSVRQEQVGRLLECDSDARRCRRFNRLRRFQCCTGKAVDWSYFGGLPPDPDGGDGFHTAARARWGSDTSGMAPF